LLLLRHAEAEALRPPLTDFERALTAQGRGQALAAAERLLQLRLRPDLLLCSPAARACATAEIVAQRLQCPQAVRYQPPLYQAGAAALLTALQHCEPGAHTLLVVAHNPGLSELVQQLAEPLAGRRADTAGSAPSGSSAAGDDLSSFTLATGALCRVTLDIESWAELGRAAVTDVALPP
jgi:phosphohistidine phosphatase